MEEINELKKDLLVADFESSYEEHRHYDEVNWDLTKFCFGQVVVILGACWTLLSFDGDNKMPINISSTFLVEVLLILSILFVLLSVIALCQNRTYFVKVNNYINELRRFALSDNDSNISNESKMWTSPNMKIFNWKSTQMICVYLCVFCGVLPACALGCLWGDESVSYTILSAVSYIIISAFLIYQTLRLR